MSVSHRDAAVVQSKINRSAKREAYPHLSNQAYLCLVKRQTEPPGSFSSSSVAVDRSRGDDGTTTDVDHKQQTRQQQQLYKCAHCDNPLFAAHDKFPSGTGWPAFSRPLAPSPAAATTGSGGGSGVRERTDWRCMEGGVWLGLRREVLCRNCDGHLGHVFRHENWDNGTGVRYCINGASIVLGDANIVRDVGSG